VRPRARPGDAAVRAAIAAYLEDLDRSSAGEDRESIQRYLGSPLPVLGVRIPTFRGLLGRLDRSIGTLGGRDFGRLLDRLWSGSVFEERLTAIELLDRHPEARSPAMWRRMDDWVDSGTGWALSDSLAAGPVAGWIAAEPRRFEELLSWTRSKNLWRRRASTYALHDWVLAGDLDRPFRLLERLLDDEEFWVRRAVGTWLRECWKRDRTRTEAFLRKHAARLSRVTITVATERAPRTLRTSLRRASRAARPDRRGKRRPARG